MRRWISWVRPPIRPFARLALGPLGRGPRQHRVLGGDPAGALAAEVRRDAVLDRRRAQDLGVAEPDEARALGPLLDAERERHRPELVAAAAVGADVGGRLPIVIGRLLPWSRAGRRVSSAFAASHSASSASKSGRAARRRARPPGARRARTGGGTCRCRRGAPPRPRSRAAGEVDEDEQQVAELLGLLRRRRRRRAARRAPRGPCRGRPRPSASRSRGGPPAPASPGSPRAPAGDRLSPSSALFARSRRSASPSARRPPPRLGPLVRLDPLPLAVDVAGGPRLGVAEHVGVAADDLRAEVALDVGQVEDALLRRQLGVEDRPGAAGRRAPRRAPASRRRRARRRPRRPPRGGGLRSDSWVCSRSHGQPSGSAQAVPRSRASPTGSRRRAPGDRAEVERAGEGVRGRARRPSVALGDAEPADRMVRRVEPAQDGERVVAARAVPARQRRGRGLAARRAGGSRPRRSTRSTAAGTMSSGPGRLDRRPDESLGGDDLEAVGEVEAPAEARLGDERVEHRGRSATASRWPGQVGRRDRGARPSGRRTSS